MLTKQLIVFFAGLIASFVNINAGGGSLLTIPALIFLGLPPVVATATNRLAILAGTLTSLFTFHKQQKNSNQTLINWKFGLIFAIPAIIGAIIGSSIIVDTSDALLKNILSFAMLTVLVLMSLRPNIPHQEEIVEFSLIRKIVLGLIFFLIGCYGGSIQVGVGFVIMIPLAYLTGFSLIQINAIKVLVVSLFTIFAVIVFIIHGKIHFLSSISLALGNILGAYLGTRFGIKKGDKWIKRIFVVAALFMAIKLFFYR